jgi:hypothetical protein
MKLRMAFAVLVLASASLASASGVHFGLVEDSDANHYYRSSGFSSFEVSFEGEIALSADKETITSMPPGASLEIRVRRLFTTRMVRVTAGDSGKPQIRYWIGDRTGSPEAGRDFLTRHLPEVARVTAVGAAAEARRLLALGPARLLDAVPALESETAQEIYLEELGKSRPADPAIGKRAVDVAAREISSSRRLRRVLSDFATAFPADPGITSALARACAEISSSSQSAAAIVEIARVRGMSAASARDYGHSVREIGSSSEKAGAIERLAPLASDPASIEALAEAAESIASSSETRRALEALSLHPDLSPATLARIISAGAKIASSSEKASFLVACAGAAAPAPEPRRAYLAVARTIESSSETRRALSALLRTGASGDGVAAILTAGKGIDSASQKGELLVQAANLPLDANAFSAYLDCAGSIDSSSEKGRAIRALLAAGTLSPAQRKTILDFAEREISSSSERESVLHAAITR